jgi:hypothetical protein
VARPQGHPKGRQQRPPEPGAAQPLSFRDMELVWFQPRINNFHLPRPGRVSRFCYSAPGQPFSFWHLLWLHCRLCLIFAVRHPLLEPRVFPAHTMQKIQRKAGRLLHRAPNDKDVGGLLAEFEEGDKTLQTVSRPSIAVFYRTYSTTTLFPLNPQCCTAPKSLTTYCTAHRSYESLSPGMGRFDAASLRHVG